MIILNSLAAWNIHCHSWKLNRVLTQYIDFHILIFVEILHLFVNSSGSRPIKYDWSETFLETWGPRGPIAGWNHVKVLVNISIVPFSISPNLENQSNVVTFLALKKCLLLVFCLFFKADHYIHWIPVSIFFHKWD